MSIKEIRNDGQRAAVLVDVLDFVSADFTTQNGPDTPPWLYKLGVNLAPGVMQAMDYVNNFQNFGGGFQTAGWWIDKDGILHMTGEVDANGSVNGETIVQISAFPPFNADGIIQFVNWSGGAPGLIQVLANGEVVWAAGAGPDISLDGICWRTT